MDNNNNIIFFFFASNVNSIIYIHCLMVPLLRATSTHVLEPLWRFIAPLNLLQFGPKLLEYSVYCLVVTRKIGSKGSLQHD